MKDILILNGAARLNGCTDELIAAFTDGAESAARRVRRFDLNDMNIHGCIGCMAARRDSTNPCTINDDMRGIYEAFASSDVVVFATPVYFWSVSGPLKTTADRLYAELECLGCGGFARGCILLATADGSDYSQLLSWYRRYEKNLGWRNLGEVLGKHRTDKARRLGSSLQGGKT